MKRIVARELMDDVCEISPALQANLADIEFANRAFGGITPFVRDVRRSGARSLLDVCCGGGDIPRALARDARHRNSVLTITALDHSPSMIAVARGRTLPGDLITYHVGDAMKLPYGDAAFDVVTCNLALHHFEPAAARTLLREIRRVAKITPLVCDLRRSVFAYAAAWSWATLFTRNALSRHDAPLSVRRAYTPAEALGLANAAGWRAPRLRREPFFRMMFCDGEFALVRA